MSFIEMTGATLRTILRDDELSPDELDAAQVVERTIVRVNRQGDIEVRRAGGWEVVGGLLGGFEDRIRQATGLEWAETGPSAPPLAFHRGAAIYAAGLSDCSDCREAATPLRCRKLVCRPRTDRPAPKSVIGSR